MPGSLKKKKASGISLLSRKKKTAAAKKTAAWKKTSAVPLTKKQARQAAMTAKVMTKAEAGILKAVIAAGISKAVRSSRAKKLLCDAVERFLQL